MMKYIRHSEGLLHQLSCNFRTVFMMSSKTSNMPRAVRRTGLPIKTLAKLQLRNFLDLGIRRIQQQRKFHPLQGQAPE